MHVGVDMKKKYILWTAGVLILAVIAFRGILPPLVDGRMNSRVPHEAYSVSATALALHNSLTVADMHADSMLWPRDFTRQHDRGLVDLPRMQQGNMALQVFGVVTKVPFGFDMTGDADSDQITLLTVASGWPTATWSSLLERTLHQNQRLKDAVARSDGQLQYVTTAGGLAAVMQQRQAGIKTMAALMGIEGAQALDKSVANITVLDKAGVRMIGLAHFFDNFIAGSAHGREKYGLTDAGKKLLGEIEARELIVDLAHAAPKAIDDVLAQATRPVVVSHGGVQGTCPGERNLSDDHVRRIAAAGGLIGIGIWHTATCGDDLGATVRAIRYTADLVGVEHVALGMDMDGSIQGFIDVSEMAALTQLLMDDGFSEPEIRAIMGENTLNFLLKWLPQG